MGTEDRGAKKTASVREKGFKKLPKEAIHYSRDVERRPLLDCYSITACPCYSIKTSKGKRLLKSVGRSSFRSLKGGREGGVGKTRGI